MSFRKDICDALGYSIDDIHAMTTWEEVDELMLAAQALSGDDFVGIANTQPVDDQGLWLAGTNCIHCGEAFADADIFDSLGDSLSVIRTDDDGNVSCVWEQVDEVTEVLERAKRWMDYGLIWRDSYFSKYDGPSGTAFASIHMTEDVAELKMQNYFSGVGVYSACIADYGVLWTSSCTNGYFAIPVTAKEVEGALRILNVIYAPETAATYGNLQVYGTEGVDYVVNDDGTFSFPEGKDKTSITFRNTDWMACCPLYLGVWEKFPADYRTTMKAKLASAELSPYFGCVIDTSDYSTLVNNIENVAVEYVMRLSWGMYTESDYAEFRSALETAGIDDYVAVYQEQLNDWLAGQ